MLASPLRVAALVLTASLTTVAAHAATISGFVKTEAGAGIGNVDVDFIDQCTGDNIFLSGDKTAADGSFSIVVAAGTYDIHFIAPAAAAVCAGDLQDIVVSTSTSLGTVTLHPGRLVAGTVKTPTLGNAANVDFKFTNSATGDRVFVTKDLTTAGGAYSIRVPSGTYDIDFRPPAGNAYTDKVRRGLVVAGSDISGLVDTLGSGFTISGTVQDKHNAKLKNVDIDVFDECTGAKMANAHDNTDVNGNYSINLPAGTYTVEYNAPHCKPVESTRVTGLLVDRSKNYGTETLRDAVLVSGVVLRSNGQPCADAKIKFYDVTAAGAPRQPADNDHADATGAFAIYVPAGTYDINAEPPAGISDQVGHWNNVVAGGNVNIGTVQCAAGIAVSGHLTAPGGGPAVNVNINAVDSATRASVRLAHDASDASGNFTVVVPAGTYDFQYDPPACSGLAPSSQDAVTVNAATTLPSLPFVTGVHLRGSVHDTHAAAVANVDLDVYPAGGSAKLYTPNDATLADGTYDLLIAPGTYDIKYIPSSVTRLRPAQKSGQAVLSTIVLPDQVLADGWLVSGTVRDAGTLLPLSGVTVDFYAPGNSTPLWTTHHVTDALGAYSVSVDAGTWNLLYTPPVGSSLAAAWSNGVAVSADLALADMLLAAPVGITPPSRGTQGLTTGPLPMRGTLDIAFAAPRGVADLEVWDATGRFVTTVWRGSAASPVQTRWTGTRADGMPVSNGIYYLRLRDSGRGGVTALRRVVVLR